MKNIAPMSWRPGERASAEKIAGAPMYGTPATAEQQGD
jgi:hypothetical protein